MLEEINHGAVREIRLACFPANAFNQAMVTRLTERLKAAALENVRAVVLSGSQGMFSGGLDMPNLINLDWNEMQRFVRSVLAFHHQLAVGTVPLVAAITGHCAAAGTVSAALCDYRIMAKGDYKIGLNEVRVGLCPGRIPYAVMRRLLGARYADQLVARGEFLTPEEALRVGMVDRVVEPDRVVPEALEYAQGFAEIPPRALSETRRIAREDLVELFIGAKREDSEELRRRWFSDETQQGLRALAAKLKKSG